VGTGQDPGGGQHHSGGGFRDLDGGQETGEGERAAETQLGELVVGGFGSALTWYRAGHDSTFRLAVDAFWRYPRGISRSQATEIHRMVADLVS
jgi:hypothetical protein